MQQNSINISSKTANAVSTALTSGGGVLTNSLSTTYDYITHLGRVLCQRLTRQSCNLPHLSMNNLGAEVWWT